jgi:predicted porin
VTLVSRYEYQESTIHTKPDGASGLTEVEASDMTSHIVGQNISWSPWARLYLQAGVNYVWSETTTPASKHTQAVLDAQNNYWTVNFNSGLVVDKKTDLNIGYFYFESDNFQNNSAAGLPLGSSAREHSVTATIVRRLSERLRLTLRYGYSHYDDVTYGGHNSDEAHFVYSAMQYRF